MWEELEMGLPTLFLKGCIKVKRQKKKMGGNQLRKRILVITLCFTVFLTLLCTRVGFIQLIKGGEYHKMATEQQTKTRIITAKRGTIYDRNGNTLAISATVYRISINPRDIRNNVAYKDTIAQHQIDVAVKLSEILELDYSQVYEKVQKNNAYQEIKRKVEDEVVVKLREWITEQKIFGVYIDEDAKRYYPNNSLAAHIIGMTGVDDQGLLGIEALYEEQLKGKNGYVLSEVDGAQKSLPFTEEVRVDPQNGNNITLTIDETIQYLVEKSLAKTIEDINVLEGAACIIMAPKTGEILAIASNPTFNLNEPFAYPEGIDGAIRRNNSNEVIYPYTALTGIERLDDRSKWTGRSAEEIDILNKTVWRSKVISDSYEPGSTFKTISTAAFLEEKIITPTTRVSDSKYVIGDRTINCWRAATHGEEPFYKAVHNSCNPVFARLAVELGVEKYYKYVDAFGFYDKTGLKFPGEGTSIFHKNPQDIDLAVTAFGQRIQITPIQLATAYCAIANGGELLVPQLVKEISDSNGNVIQKSEKEVVRQAVSAETCKIVMGMLEGVVSEGTGSNAYVSGLRIAGKTGTSQTTTTEIDGRYIISFAGIAPADNPEIVCLYILDHPNVQGNNTGGASVAPAAGKLMEEVLNYLKTERIYSDKDVVKKSVPVPVLENKSIQDIKNELSKVNLNIKVVGDNTDTAVAVKQMPAAGFSIPEGSSVIIYTSGAESQETIVPDVKNMAIDLAFSELKNSNLCMKISGKGVAVSQNPAPGTKVPIGTIVTVEFRAANEGANAMT